MWKLVLILVSCVFVTTSCSRVPETGNSGEDRLPVITPKEVRVRAAATFDDHVEERRMGKPMKLERDEEEGATSWQFLSSASSSTSSEDQRAKGGQEKKGLHGENEEGTNDEWRDNLILAGDFDPPPPPAPLPRPQLLRPRHKNRQQPQQHSSSSSTKTPLIGFSVVRAKDDALNGENRNKIGFDHVLTDLNGAWNNNEAVFRCKHPGLYFFSFNGRGSGLGNNETDATELESIWLVSLMLNGVEVVSIGGETESSSSNSILLPLNRGDEIWLQLMQGKLLEAENRSRTGLTSFSGYLVGVIHPEDIAADVMNAIKDVDDDDDWNSKRREEINDERRRYSSYEDSRRHYYGLENHDRCRSRRCRNSYDDYNYVRFRDDLRRRRPSYHNHHKSATRKYYYPPINNQRRNEAFNRRSEGGEFLSLRLASRYNN